MSDNSKKDDKKPSFFHKPGEDQDHKKQKSLIDDAVHMIDHELGDSD